MFILMCPTFVQQQARAQMDACVCFREKRTVPQLWTDLGASLLIAHMTLKHLSNCGHTFTRERERFLMK